MTLDADIVVAGVGSQRVVKASEFFVAMMTTCSMRVRSSSARDFPELTTGEGHG